MGDHQVDSGAQVPIQMRAGASRFVHCAVVPTFTRASRWAMIGAAAIAVTLLVGIVQQPAVRFNLKTVAPVDNDALPVASLTSGAA